MLINHVLNHTEYEHNLKQALCSLLGLSSMFTAAVLTDIAAGSQRENTSFRVIKITTETSRCNKVESSFNLHKTSGPTITTRIFTT